MMGLLYFIIGAMAGSVANAVIYRLPRNISWIRGHSMCTKCKHELKFWDLIPLFSYLFLAGKCRYCRRKIGTRYIIVEASMALGFLVLGNPLWCAIFWITTVIGVMDWETKLVSEVLVLVWGLLIIGNFSILGMIVGILVIGGLWALSRGRAMGFGDVEIVAVMGLWLGWPKIAIAIWIAFVVGAIVGCWFVVRKKTSIKSQIAFGPFLILGTWIAFFAGDMINKYVFPF